VPTTLAGLVLFATRGTSFGLSTLRNQPHARGA
jgi:hypothetical protein